MELQCVKKLKLPEWFILEKETENTISKLTSLKDLSYYLRHQDSNIRRMAILRINELKLKESIDILSEVMDDPSESSINKELVAWTIKAVSIKWDVDLYVSSRLLSRYSGNEQLSKLFTINIIDNGQKPVFRFPSILENGNLDFKDTDMRTNDNISLDMSFSFNEWMTSWYRSIPGSVKKQISVISSKIMAVFDETRKKLLSTIQNPKSRPSRKGKLSQASTNKKKQISQLPENYIRYTFKHRVKHKVVSIWRLIGKILFKSAYLFFTPVRIVVKHRKIAFAMLLTAYLLGVYTEPGKYFTYKYFRTDLAETQAQVYYTSREIITYAWAEFKDIVGLPDQSYGTVYGTESRITD